MHDAYKIESVSEKGAWSFHLAAKLLINGGQQQYSSVEVPPWLLSHTEWQAARQEVMQELRKRL